MVLIVRRTILFIWLIIVESNIYLYETEDASVVEFYDCLLVNSLYYCRRPEKPIELTRENDNISCQQNGGIMHRFENLRLYQLNINIILHEWKSSVERVEQYVSYLQNFSDSDGYICQCVQPTSFGKNCEYRLPNGLTFDESISWQLARKQRYPWEAQLYGDIVCYKTLLCDSGLLCLDWREICDGIQNCMYGYDEENCDLLEMNQCNDDEYRCMNGMCIPEQFFLDGEFDCLDWSDELQYKKSESCATEAASSECDDHVCAPNEWSCGDGQCIYHRLAFQKPTPFVTCRNRRDQAFMCEISRNALTWTLDNGRCHGGKQYVASVIKNNTDEERCQYMLKCALSQGGEKKCPCLNNRNCTEVFVRTCSLPLLAYPNGAILAPYIFFFYNNSWYDGKLYPEFVLLNGTVKCHGSLVYLNSTILFNHSMTNRQITADIFCHRNNFHCSELCHNVNQSIDLCHEWNPCMSITRINDGFSNCLNGRDEIEKNCSDIKQHRFRCSEEQPTCLSIMAMGNGKDDCQNRFDESWFGKYQKLSEMNCNSQSRYDCLRLRQYIKHSWTSSTSDIQMSSLVIPFRAYCDTFWNLDGAEDENTHACNEAWVCAENQWRCPTGQCIDRHWIYDLEWDCEDGADERHFFNLTVKLMQRALSFTANVESYSSLLQNQCDPAISFICLSPSRSQQPFKCINYTQLGDHKIDCAGAIDERNTFHDCSQSSMLGYHFLCPSTNTCIPYYLHCQDEYRCPNRADDEIWCIRRQKNSISCTGPGTVLCFDGTCYMSGRCDGFPQCLFTEDEYMCDYPSVVQRNLGTYRQEKQDQAKMSPRIFQTVPFPTKRLVYGSIANRTIRINNRLPLAETKSVIYSPSSTIAYLCNRGVGIWSSNNSIVCFCPPQYYGTKCEYHADRLSVLLHLDLSQSIYTTYDNRNVTLKLLILFLFEDEVLMNNVFDVRPFFDNAAEKKNKQKKKLISYFVYSHSNKSLEERRHRFYNRSDLLQASPYSIRIEAYENYQLKKPALVAVWNFLISFDHLPVYRLAKVLHWSKPNMRENACLNNRCNEQSNCYVLMNNPSQYICLCKANFTGVNCSEDQHCKNDFCSSDALCKPNYRRNSLPYCVCPSHRHGVRCELDYNTCHSNSCLNGGSCLPTAELNRIICLCPEIYYGSRCEWKKPLVNLSLYGQLTHMGATIQYFDIDFIPMDLILAHQEVHRVLPPSINYYHEKLTIPEIIVAKIFTAYDDSSSHLYLLSLQMNTTSIEGRVNISKINHCPSLRSIINDDISPIRYHQICQNHTELLCFRDQNYLCICVDHQLRAECFRYDNQLDQCSHCLSDGRCLTSDIHNAEKFLCICPPCYSGRQCEFNSKSFTFTLDQLFYADLLSSNRYRTSILLLVFSILGLMLAIPNNLFSYVTVRRRACLRTGIGYYLLYLSAINQINLGLFLARIIHLILQVTDVFSAPTWNNILCKLLNYLLISSSRIILWLTSLIAIERVYLTIFVQGQWLKQPHIARRLIAISITCILISDVYECFFYKSFDSLTENQGSICVFEFPISYRAQWIGLHLFVSTLHYLLPFLINLCSTITISIIIIRKKMNTIQSVSQKSNKLLYRLRLATHVLAEKKELVLGPGITLVPQLFSLPIFIASFVLDCQKIENTWLRYLLIASYWISFIPQWTSFFLYISPSSFYSSEWHKTRIGQSIYQWFNRNILSTTMTKLAPSAIQEKNNYHLQSDPHT